jgi:L-ascorbate metabolism protein UlaG (beta-lactamase superfamily)
VRSAPWQHRRMFARDIAWGPDAFSRRGEADGLRVQWLGAAGFALEHRGWTLLVDPYVTRAPLARCLLAPLLPDVAAIRRHMPRANAIVVGHTHFDHALDVPEIAKRTGARVFGSRSASALCLAAGVPADRVEVVEREAGCPPAEHEVGPFALRFVPSAHSRLVLGRVPFPGDIADCSDIPMRAHRYRCGHVFGVEIRVAGRVLYHMGSAELVDAAAPMKHIDMLLLCVAGWTASRDLPERIAHHVAPGAILLSHWDNFLRPLHAPALELPAMEMPRLVDRLTRATRGTKIGTLALLGEAWL